MSHVKSTNSLDAIKNLLNGKSEKTLSSIEHWNPPYCGDIGLSIKANGTWTYQNTPINRASLVKLFSTALFREQDGRTYLVTPVEKVDVVVADAAFIAVELDVHGHGREQKLIFRTNVDDVINAGPEHPLRFEVDPATGGIKPYLLIRHRLEALLTRAVTRELFNLIEDIEAPGIWSNGFFFKIPSIE